MKHARLSAIAAMVLVVTPILAVAQARPDFSGKWKYNTAKSSRGTEGNSADMTYPSELVLKQTADVLTFQGISLRQDDTKAVYMFNGSEVSVTSTPGITQKAKATWDGSKLVITAQRSIPSPIGGTFVTDIKEVWTLNGNVLTIQKTETAEGLSDTKNFVFDKVG